MTGYPVVSVWRFDGTRWVQVGQIADFEELRFAPAHNDLGDWSMRLPFQESALLLTRDRLVTVDWRGVRSTWCVSVFNPASDDESGEPMLNVSGVGAVSMLSRCLAWPDPALPIDEQPVITENDPAPYDSTAETVISSLVAGNYRDRYGARVTVPASQGRGGRVQSRPEFDNLLELVQGLAKIRGLRVDVGLVNQAGTSTRADLTLLVSQPVDRTSSVRLTAAAGTLDEWSQADTEPTATAALVAGAGGTAGPADRVLQWPVTTSASSAAAAAWGGVREVFVDGPNTFDPAELVQAGEQALVDGASSRTLSLVSSEADDMQAFVHYNVGDRATAEVLTGASVADVISTIEVTFTDDGFDVAPLFGNPSDVDPELDIAEQIGVLRQAVRRQERK